MMQVYKRKDMCTGCTACVNICPKQCITMAEDSFGFLYPQVDLNKCINCGLCKEHCLTYVEENNAIQPKVYSFTNSNIDVLLSSSSGGAFYAIASSIIEKGGYVCSAIFDIDWSVKHIVSNNLEDLRAMQGSKYLQSKLGNCYKQIKDLLENNKIVLFVGTPCQVLGLKQYLKKDFENLYLIDLICNSVPSPLIFKEYLKLLEQQVGTIQEINLRSKQFGWISFGIYAKGNNGNVFLPRLGNEFYDGFLDGLYHRASCNECPVKTVTGYQSDVTLGDFWGFEKLYPEKNCINGVSAVLVNTPKGGALVTDMDLTEESFESFKNTNQKYLSSKTISPKSEIFWEKYRSKGLKAAYKKVYRKPIKVRIKTIIKNFLHK